MNLPGTSSARVALIPFAAAVLLLTATSTRVDAIRFGALDGNAHPYVGLAVFDDAAGNPMWRCTGTLLSPTIFLTAGHCTDGAAGATIWFESEVLRGDPAFNYPFGGPTSVEGTPHTHPQYNPGAFYLFDLGVVVLHTPVAMPAYGQLPPLGLFDPLFTRRGLQNQDFTPVGYGLQFTNPARTQADLTRYRASVSIITGDSPFGGHSRFDTDDESVLFTSNASGGGTCFGDSGGPIFWPNSRIVAAVTSFGINQNCAGTGGGYRVDTADDLDWLATFGLFPAP
jgi:hypothetical protein